jgi:hypothetical protein
MMDIIWQSILESLLKGAGDLMNLLQSLSIGIFELPLVAQIIDVFTSIGWVLVATGILFAVAQTAIAYSEDGILEYHKLILNIFYSIIAVLALAPGAKEIFTFAAKVTKAITDDMNKNYNEIFEKLQIALKNPPDPAVQGATSLSVFWVLIVMIVIIVALFIIFFQVLKRSGIYLIQILVGYMHLFSIPLGNYDSFFGWIKMTVALAITNVIQITMLMLGLNQLASFKFTDILLGIGILIACTEVERVAKTFGFQVNSRKSIAAVGSSISSSVSIAKNIKVLKGG